MAGPVCANGCGPLRLGLSRCDTCGGYTTIETGNMGVTGKNNVVCLDQVKGAEVPRLKIGEPYDSVWGGGLVPTTTTMLAATAGCGKTRMMLKISSFLAKQTGKFAYYISAEQPASELRLMCDQLQIDNMDRIVVLKDFGTGAEFDEGLLKEKPPCIFVNDSVTDMAGKDPSAQLSIAKSYKKVAIKCVAPAVLISHMNKAGDTSGLYRMHHTVDVLIALGNLLAEPPREISKFLDQGFPESLLDGEGGENIKCICAFKNRHGPTGKDYYLYMTEHGLVPLIPPPKKGKPGRPPLDKEKREELIARGTRLARDTLGPPRDGGSGGSKKVIDIADARSKRAGLAKDEIEHRGQKLVNRKTALKKKVDPDGPIGLVKDKPEAEQAKAIEGEAVKQKRAAMPRTKQARDEARKRMKARKKQTRKSRKGKD